jgi:hypothetical protein
MSAQNGPLFAGVSNVRTALEWCFAQTSDLPTGIGLAAAAAPVLLAMSLLPECHHWSQRALAALDDQVSSKSDQMHLQAGLGISSMHLYGENEHAREALNRSLALAEAEHDAANEAGLLGMLHMFHFRSGDFNVALSIAKRCRALADTVDDPAGLALAHSILGRSLLDGRPGRRARQNSKRCSRIGRRPSETRFIWSMIVISEQVSRSQGRFGIRASDPGR